MHNPEEGLHTHFLVDSPVTWRHLGGWELGGHGWREASSVSLMRFPLHPGEHWEWPVNVSHHENCLSFCTLIHWEVKALVIQSCLTLCNPTGCSPPGSSVHGTLQARILERVAISFSGESPQPRIEPTSPALAGRFFTTEPPGQVRKP